MAITYLEVCALCEHVKFSVFNGFKFLMYLL